MISECVKMGLLLISAFGYWEYFRSKHEINVYFVPFFTISVQFSFLFAAGLLNCLKEATVLLHSVGFLLFVGGVYKKRFRVFSPYMNVGYLFFLLAFGVAGLAVQGTLFTQIDNFTHWATVVRNMLSTDRFPNFQATVVEFTSYPLGSSALIYFVCKMVGEAEYIQMWAQAYLMLCAILPVFSCCQKNKGVYLVLTAAMTGFLFNYNIPITELLVDTLMPLAGMATALFIWHHCTHWKAKTELSSRIYIYIYIYIVPLLIWTMNIKHAALIFVVFDLVLLYLCIRKRKQGRRQWALTAGILFLVNLLWGRHCDYVFAGASVSRHSLSVDWFGMILGDKTTEEIADTVKMVLVRLVTRTECLWILAWFLVLGMLVLRGVNKGVKKQYALFLVSGVSLYGVYSIGIGAMYVFSMENYGELLAFTRYMRSIDVAIYYMLTVFSGLYLTELTNRQHAVTVGIILIFLTAAGWHWQTGEYLKEKLACCPVEWRQELEQPITEYRIQRGKRYLLCVNEEHHGWPRRLWRYNLQTDAVDQVMVTDVSELQIVKDYDYVVVLDEGNPIIEAWVRENYPDAIGNTVIENFL